MVVTLKKEVTINGNGLMKNKPCEVTLFPSKTGQIRYFIQGKEPFVSNVDNVLATDHCVVLGNKNSQAMLTEHLTAALAFCHIDSVDICMSEQEVPILDGSSKVWVNAIQKAGIDKPMFFKEKKYTVSEPVYYLNGKTSLVILPDKNLFISYAVNYDHPQEIRRFVNYNPQNCDEIIEARTFGFYRDLKKFQMLGFAKGASKDNTLGFMDDGGYSDELRSDSEPLKHKILDLVGDLYLTGINPLDLNCQILAKEAGHAVHIKVAKILKDKIIEL